MAQRRSKVEQPEEEVRQLCGLLQESEDRIFQLNEYLRQAELERDDYKSKHEIVRQELQATQGAYEVEIRKGNLLEAQLDNDSTQCQREMCVKLKKDYDALATEKAQLSEENHQQTQTISDLKKTIQDLNGKLTVVNLQVETYKLDFKAERKDREAAHSKLADLERELAREKGLIDVERATYETHFREDQHGELKKQNEKLEKDMEKLRNDLSKHKIEANKLREEILAKVSQVRQYKKENDRLKTQVEQYVSSMEALTDEMEAIKKRRSDELLKANVSSEKNAAVAEMGNHHHCFQSENEIKPDTVQFTKKKDSRNDDESKSQMASPLVQPGDPNYKESRTTHLEKRLDKMLLDMQSMAAENEKLHVEIYQMKRANKQPGAVVATSHDELHEDLLAKVDPNKHQKKLPPLCLRSCDPESPPATQNRSRSPSPVAVVKPTFQRQKPRPPYRQYASVGPVMVEAHPLAQPVSPPLPHAHYYNQQQQINVMENATVKIDNPQPMKQDVKDVEELDDRPFDPNLICPMCKQQFRIGEIQGYSKHYKICQKQSEEETFQLDLLRQNMAGDTQPFTPIQYPSTDVQSVSQTREVMPEPKLLCRTPGCSFKGYEDLGGLCPDCSSQGNIQEDQ